MRYVGIIPKFSLMVKKFQDYNAKSYRLESYGKLTPALLAEAVA
jgi:hypothetical protein